MAVRPNLLLVTVDSLRADRFGPSSALDTPRFDSLVADGVNFENAVAPGPYTEVSVPATLTGRFPVSEPGGAVEMATTRDAVRHHVDAHGTVADELRRLGYETAGFSPNPHASRYFGLDSGFDRFEDFLGSRDGRTALRELAGRLRDGDPVEGLRLAANVAGLSIPGFGSQSIPFRAYAPKVDRWLEDATEPWFLWVFLLETHSPYRPTREFRSASLARMLYLNLVRSGLVDRDPTDAEGTRIERLYDETVEMTDRVVADLLGRVPDDTAVVVHADHGEAFGEHGHFGHDGVLYDETVNVPLVVGGLPATKTVTGAVSLRSLPAMLVEIAETGSLDPGSHTAEFALSRVPGRAVAARSESEKLVYGSRGRRYDLAADPGERSPRDVDGRVPGVIARFVAEREETVAIRGAAEGHGSDADA